MSSLIPFDEQWTELMTLERRLITEDPARWIESARMLYRHAYKAWFLDLLNLWSDTMARSKQPPTPAPKKTPQASWTQFVTIAVSEADKPKIALMYPDSSEVFVDFTRLLVAGYRVSFSYDAPRDAVICAVTCKAEGDPNNGMTFTAFAGDWYTALTVAMYKHYHVAGEVWNADSAAAQRPDFG